MSIYLFIYISIRQPFCKWVYIYILSQNYFLRNLFGKSTRKCDKTHEIKSALLKDKTSTKNNRFDLPSNKTPPSVSELNRFEDAIDLSKLILGFHVTS